jgi:hypothetical protein
MDKNKALPSKVLIHYKDSKVGYGISHGIRQNRHCKDADNACLGN